MESIRRRWFVSSWMIVCVGLWSFGAAAETDPPAPPRIKGDKRTPPARRPAKRAPAPRRAIKLAPRAAPPAQPKATTTPPDPSKMKIDDRPVAKPTGKPKWRKYGIEIRGAALFIPEFFLTGLFFDEADGVTNGGFGLAFVLKTSATFEFAFGVGYKFLNFIGGKDTAGNPIPHVFVNKGDEPYDREFVLNTLSYLSIDVRFLKLFPVAKHFQFLVGFGLGLGILFGGLSRTDTYIPGYTARDRQVYKDAYGKWKQDKSNPANKLPNELCQSATDGQGGTDCQLHAGLDENKAIKDHRDTGTPEGRKEDRAPPVIPVANFILGMVFPIIVERWDIRIQGGIGVPRIFWVGMASHVYF